MPEPIHFGKKQLDNAYNNIYKNNNTSNNSNSNSNSNNNNSYLMLPSVEYTRYYNEVSIIDSKFTKTSK